MTHDFKGFTLIELMLVIALIAIMAGLGLPAFRNMILDNRIVTTSNGLLGALQVARSEAVTRRANITVCPSDDQATCTEDSEWQEGTLILQGNTLLHLLPAAATGVQVTANSDQVVYLPNGQLQPMAAVSLEIKDARGSGATSRIICISLLGQASIVRGDQACP